MYNFSIFPSELMVIAFVLICMILACSTLGIAIAIPLSLRKSKLNAINAMPEQKSWAKIVNKAPLNSLRFTGKVWYRSLMLCVTFEFHDGTRKDFQVTREIFNTVLENETGFLTYKEKANDRLFIHFERDNNSNSEPVGGY